MDIRGVSKLACLILDCLCITENSLWFQTFTKMSVFKNNKSCYFVITLWGKNNFNETLKAQNQYAIYLYDECL